MKGRKLAHIERGSSEKWLLYSYSRVSNNRTGILNQLAKSKWSLRFWSTFFTGWFLARLILQVQHQIVLFCKPHEIELCTNVRYCRVELKFCSFFLSLKSALHFLRQQIAPCQSQKKWFFFSKLFLRKLFFSLWPVASPHPVRFMSFLVELRNWVVLPRQQPILDTREGCCLTAFRSYLTSRRIMSHRPKS